MINIDLAKIDKVKIRKGLEKYIKINDLFNSLNKANEDFIKVYRSFYVVRQRNEFWYKTYFDLLFESKGENVNYEELLKYFYSKVNKVETSFISKLIHTTNHSKPIFDRNVLASLRLKYNYSSSPEKKIEKAVSLYNEIDSFYKEYLISEDAQEKIEYFDINFPNGKNINNVKKIDFLLWASK